MAKPMPRYWHDRHSVNQIEDPEERRFQLSIVADKKPYFMRIIYPTLARQYNTYIKTTDKNSIREFGMTVQELEQIPEEKRTERQNDFIRYYYTRMPVGIGDCVMNKICRRFEQEFNRCLCRSNGNTPFDYSILKSGLEYKKSEFVAVSKLYDSYRKRLQQFTVFRAYERVDELDAIAHLEELKNEFKRDCDIACPNERTRSDILVDICYVKSTLKKFAWEMCGKEMLKNLLDKNENKIIYPTLDPDGDIIFKGKAFSVREFIKEEENVDCAE